MRRNLVFFRGRKVLCYSPLIRGKTTQNGRRALTDAKGTGHGPQKIKG